MIRLSSLLDVLWLACRCGSPVKMRCDAMKLLRGRQKGVFLSTFPGEFFCFQVFLTRTHSVKSEFFSANEKEHEINRSHPLMYCKIQVPNSPVVLIGNVRLYKQIHNQI